MTHHRKTLPFKNILKRGLSAPSTAVWDAIESCVTSSSDPHGGNAQKNQATVNTLAAQEAFFQWWDDCCDILPYLALVICDVKYRADSKSGEYIELLNHGKLTLDLSDLQINAGNKGQDFFFPKFTILQPHTKIRIHTQTTGRLSFKSKQPLLNNKGDSVFLRDKAGIGFCSWAYGRDAHDDIKISLIHFDGEQVKTEGDEYIELENTGPHWIDLSEWNINAGKCQNFTFPRSSHIAPYSCIRIYTNLIEPRSGGYSFDSAQAIWNNKGDTGLLTDSNGCSVDQYSYGTI